MSIWKKAVSALTGKHPMEFTMDDVFYVRELSEEGESLIIKKLSDMSIRNVTYGLHTCKISRSLSKGIHKRVKETCTPIVYLNTVCKFYKPTKDRTIITSHKIYVIGHDGLLYKIELETYVKCKFLSKFYDSDIIMITSIIAEDLIKQNKRFENLTDMVVTIPDYSKINMIHREEYHTYMMISTNQSITDGAILSLPDDDDVYDYMDYSYTVADHELTRTLDEVKKDLQPEAATDMEEDAENVVSINTDDSDGDARIETVTIQPSVSEETSPIEYSYDGEIINFSDINRKDVTLRDVLDMMAGVKSH